MATRGTKALAVFPFVQWAGSFTQPGLCLCFDLLPRYYIIRVGLHLGQTTVEFLFLGLGQFGDWFLGKHTPHDNDTKGASIPPLASSATAA